MLSLMLRFFLFSLLVFWQCTPNKQTETYRFDQIIVTKFPTNPPPAFPQSFFPEKSTFLQSSEFKTSHIHTKEAFLLLETPESWEEIQKRIDYRVNQGDWKLIEKNVNETEVSYLLEGFIKKSLSIYLTKNESNNQIRFYFKKHSTY
ncbi:hypothetical protein CH354_07905 [Leptospira levettii]|nr:hypothetical protein CH354_07905 [Leptospira levettii]PJZ88554.1 hypothetical protein CH368_11225 [Leptospira levettii]PJZ98966.1 hypothetical protein CH369_17595 [Leptospira levettii]